MIILGIDPGLATVGYAVIEQIGNRTVPITYNHIQTSAKATFYSRLLEISHLLRTVIQNYKPTTLSIEKLFFSKNTKTAMTIAHVRGAIILDALTLGLEVFEYTPNEVKLAVTGYGAAPKQQIQQMVKSLLNLSEIPKPDDTADALAIAICHQNSYRIKSLERSHHYV